MKAISLWQPWASLIAAGIKPFETRSWAPPEALIGQRIAIHAAKKIDREAAMMAEDLLYGQHGHDLADRIEATFSEASDKILGVFNMATLPIGCIVCTAKLDAAFQMGPGGTVTARMTSRPMPECFRPRIDAWGDYSPGRWAWLLSEVQVVNPPAPVNGRQGFFDLPQGWLA